MERRGVGRSGDGQIVGLKTARACPRGVYRQRTVGGGVELRCVRHDGEVAAVFTFAPALCTDDTVARARAWLDQIDPPVQRGPGLRVMA